MSPTGPELLSAILAGIGAGQLSTPAAATVPCRQIAIPAGCTVDQSTNLKLPYLMPSQAQKHVTHNEALRMLDALVQLSVLDKDLATPPGSPTEGQRYIVAASPTGAWAGQATKIAAWQDGAWAFFAPVAGWRAWVADEALIYYWSGASWQSVASALAVLQNLSLLGVGTTADATNPFSAKLNKALWTAKTTAEGGDGDLRTTLNKETASDVLSMLFQTGFSGRAEAGLIGDNDFTVKVSPDGSAWHNAIVIDRTTGRPSFPSGGAATTPATTTTGHVPTYANTSGNQLDTGFAVTAAAKTVLDDASVSAMLTTLGFSTFFKTLVDDAAAANVLVTLGVRLDFGSIADDSVATIAYGAFFGAFVLLNSSASSNTKPTLLWLRGASSPENSLIIEHPTATGMSWSRSTSTLTGTTGTDGTQTIGVDASGNIQVENRRGFALSVSAFIFKLF